MSMSIGMKSRGKFSTTFVGTADGGGAPTEWLGGGETRGAGTSHPIKLVGEEQTQIREEGGPNDGMRKRRRRRTLLWLERWHEQREHA